MHDVGFILFRLPCGRLFRRFRRLFTLSGKSSVFITTTAWPLSSGKIVTDVSLVTEVSERVFLFTGNVVSWRRIPIVDGRGNRSSDKVFFFVRELIYAGFNPP